MRDGKLRADDQGMKAFDMTMDDAALVLLLAARLQGTDAAVREAAKRCAKCLPRSDRPLMYDIVNSRDPLQIIATWTELSLQFPDAK